MRRSHPDREQAVRGRHCASPQLLRQGRRAPASSSRIRQCPAAFVRIEEILRPRTSCIGIAKDGSLLGRVRWAQARRQAQPPWPRPDEEGDRCSSRTLGGLAGPTSSEGLPPHRRSGTGNATFSWLPETARSGRHLRAAWLRSPYPDPTCEAWRDLRTGEGHPLPVRARRPHMKE